MKPLWTLHALVDSAFRWFSKSSGKVLFDVQALELEVISQRLLISFIHSCFFFGQKDTLISASLYESFLSERQTAVHSFDNASVSFLLGFPSRFVAISDKLSMFPFAYEIIFAAATTKFLQCWGSCSRIYLHEKTLSLIKHNLEIRWKPQLYYHLFNYYLLSCPVHSNVLSV